MTSKREGVAGDRARLRMLIRIIPAGILCWAMAGCDTPPDIQPMAPPGAQVPRKSPDEEPAQAQGEVPAATTAQEKASAGTKEVAELPVAPSTAPGETRTTAGGVKYETLREGTGPEYKGGKTALFRYEGKLENGRVFDSNRGSAEAFPTDLTNVIAGWKEGLPGMKAGEIRRLTIPSDKAYGDAGYGDKIPPNSTLIFEVELVKIRDQ